MSIGDPQERTAPNRPECPQMRPYGFHGKRYQDGTETLSASR